METRREISRGVSQNKSRSILPEKIREKLPKITKSSTQNSLADVVAPYVVKREFEENPAEPVHDISKFLIPTEIQIENLPETRDVVVELKTQRTVNYKKVIKFVLIGGTALAAGGVYYGVFAIPAAELALGGAQLVLNHKNLVYYTAVLILNRNVRSTFISFASTSLLLSNPVNTLVFSITGSSFVGVCVGYAALGIASELTSKGLSFVLGVEPKELILRDTQSHLLRQMREDYYRRSQSKNSSVSVCNKALGYIRGGIGYSSQIVDLTSWTIGIVSSIGFELIFSIITGNFEKLVAGISSVILKNFFLNFATPILLKVSMDFAGSDSMDKAVDFFIWRRIPNYRVFSSEYLSRLRNYLNARLGMEVIADLTTNEILKFVGSNLIKSIPRVAMLRFADSYMSKQSLTQYSKTAWLQFFGEESPETLPKFEKSDFENSTQVIDGEVHEYSSQSETQTVQDSIAENLSTPELKSFENEQTLATQYTKYQKLEIASTDHTLSEKTRQEAREEMFRYQGAVENDQKIELRELPETVEKISEKTENVEIEERIERLGRLLTESQKAALRNGENVVGLERAERVYEILKERDSEENPLKCYTDFYFPEQAGYENCSHSAFLSEEAEILFDKGIIVGGGYSLGIITGIGIPAIAGVEVLNEAVISNGVRQLIDDLDTLKTKTANEAPELLTDELVSTLDNILGSNISKSIRDDALDIVKRLKWSTTACQTQFGSNAACLELFGRIPTPQYTSADLMQTLLHTDLLAEEIVDNSQQILFGNDSEYAAFRWLGRMWGGTKMTWQILGNSSMRDLLINGSENGNLRLKFRNLERKYK